MRANPVRTLWAHGKAAVNGWLGIGNSYSAELLASLDYDCITVDLQHGLIDLQTAAVLFQAISAYHAAPLARVHDNEPGAIMKLLDAGAYGIICPLVNSRAECERFVAACRYPPRGSRSFGPARAVLYGGADYFAHADDTVLTLAMIETRQALDNLDDILSVAELDAVFIGPNDLALALGCPPSSEPPQAVVVAAIETIRRRAQACGKKVGIFCSCGLAARDRLAQGFDLVTPGHDAGLLQAAAAAALRETRNH